MGEYTVEPLGSDTWDAFVQLAERHNGVWNGCWCTWFHPAFPEKGQSPEGNRALKKRLVNEGRAHAALVFDADVAVAWCQYGNPEELPGRTRSLFEQAGFSYDRAKGKNHCVMSKTVARA